MGRFVCAPTERWQLLVRPQERMRVLPREATKPEEDGRKECSIGEKSGEEGEEEFML